MKRLAVALVPVALLVSACAVGVPQPPTSPALFGDSIVLNAKVASSIDGPTDYWFRYGERGDSGNWSETPHQTVEVTEGRDEPVSSQLTGLEPSHRYGWQVCVADRARTRPASSAPRSESSAPSATWLSASMATLTPGAAGRREPRRDHGGEPVTCCACKARRPPPSGWTGRLSPDVRRRNGP